MEKYRVTLFIIIVIAVWFFYYLFFLPKVTKTHPSTQNHSSQSPASPEGIVQKTEEEQKQEVFDKSVTLKSDYLHLELFISETSIKFDTILPKFQNTKKEIYKLSESNILKLFINNTLTRIRSVNIKENNLVIEFEPLNKITTSLLCSINEDYIFICTISFENESAEPLSFHPSFELSTTIFAETANSQDIELIYGYFFKDTSFKFKSSYNPQELTFEAENNKKLKWAGLKNKYFIFTTIWEIPDLITTVKYSRIASLQKSISGLFKYLFSTLSIQPKSSITIPIKWYCGPKQKEFLTKYKDLNIDILYNFGFFDSISKFLFIILTFIYDIFGNYGVAIIFLTLLVRMCLLPISVLHQRSIQKLQAVQPLINKIKEKYKDNKEKMQKEFRKIYEKYQINPVMGCLPLFIQIPILLGLFNLFDRAIELRLAKCFLWIDDLSHPDRAIDIKMNIMGDNYLHILPVLNVVVWIIQIILAKNTSMAGTNPESEKSMRLFMYLMPVIFGFALYNAPSGLNLYWLFTTAFSIFESYLIKRIIKKDIPVINE